MKRAKPPKKKQSLDEKLIKKVAKQKTDQIYEEISKKMSENLYPIFLLACKDEFKLNNDQVEKLVVRLERYINHVGEKLIGIDEVKEILEKENY